MDQEKKPKKSPNKFVQFFKRYPVIISLVILVPALLYSIRYMFTADNSYYNFSYDGERIKNDHKNFELTGIKKVANVLQTSTFFSYQGGACYRDYYAICTDCFESILIYNTSGEKLKVEHNITTGMDNTQWHCNQIFFGVDFYSLSDKFPLLYVSMEHPDVHSLMAFRIFQKAGTYSVELVQQISLDFSAEKDKIYYPNAYFDYDDEYVYYGGYTENSYMKSATNKLKFYKFRIPDYRLRFDYFETKDSLETFELPSETATQGGFISDGHLYQTFSFNSKTDINRAPKMKVVDLESKEIIHDYQNLGEQFGVYEEFEHVAIARNGKMYSLGNPYNIYEFEYGYDKSK